MILLIQLIALIVLVRALRVTPAQRAAFAAARAREGAPAPNALLALLATPEFKAAARKQGAQWCAEASPTDVLAAVARRWLSSPGVHAGGGGRRGGEGRKRAIFLSLLLLLLLGKGTVSTIQFPCWLTRLRSSSCCFAQGRAVGARCGEDGGGDDGGGHTHVTCR